MEEAHRAKPIASRELEETLKNHHGHLVAQMIETTTPNLFQMKLTLCTTNDMLPP
jgi:hypothetical protein